MALHYKIHHTVHSEIFGISKMICLRSFFCFISFTYRINILIKASACENEMTFIYFFKINFNVQCFIKTHVA